MYIKKNEILEWMEIGAGMVYLEVLWKLEDLLG